MFICMHMLYGRALTTTGRDCAILKLFYCMAAKGGDQDVGGSPSRAATFRHRCGGTGSSGDVEIFKSIQGVRKKRSILCLVEPSRPIPNLLKKRA